MVLSYNTNQCNKLSVPAAALVRVVAVLVLFSLPMVPGWEPGRDPGNDVLPPGTSDSAVTE